MELLSMELSQVSFLLSLTTTHIDIFLILLNPRFTNFVAELFLTSNFCFVFFFELHCSESCRMFQLEGIVGIWVLLSIWSGL